MQDEDADYQFAQSVSDIERNSEDSAGAEDIAEGELKIAEIDLASINDDVTPHISKYVTWSELALNDPQESGHRASVDRTENASTLSCD